MKKVIILMGAPGSGKGTHAEMLEKAYNIPHLSTGDMLRLEVAHSTLLGQKIKNIMNEGNLVNDDIMNQLIANRIEQNDCKNGFILDGYPRTLNQAKSLDITFLNQGVKDYKVIELHVQEDILIKRILGRYICKNCGAIYNEYFYPPKVENTCDACGKNEFIKRKDDNTTTISERLAVYAKQTIEVLEYYKKHNKYYMVNGELAKEEVEAAIVGIIEAKQ